jgi:hypothetical protein
MRNTIIFQFLALENIIFLNCSPLHSMSKLGPLIDIETRLYKSKLGPLIDVETHLYKSKNESQRL